MRSVTTVKCGVTLLSRSRLMRMMDDALRVSGKGMM